MTTMRLDRMGHKIETLFPRQKDWRPITTRYDPCPTPFALLSFGPLLSSSGDES